MLEHALIIILSYGLLGAGIKYIDQAYDLGVFSKKKANLVAIPSGILMAYLIISDPPSATIFFSIFVVVAVTRKIDNPAFYMGTGILLLLPIIFHGIMKIEWIPFGILILSGIIDEIGNDWADKRKEMRRLSNDNRRNPYNSTLKKFGEKFFLHRSAMKIGVLVLTIFGFFRYLYLFAFLFFDMMYLLVEQYSLSIKVYSISRPVVSKSKW